MRTPACSGSKRTGRISRKRGRPRLCVIRNGHRAGEIIKSVRALTRKSAPEMVSLDINDVIREVIVLMGGEFRRRGVRVETLLSSDLGSVIGDRVQLQQVVLNLIMNGIEAMADFAHGQRRIQIRSGNDEAPGGVLVAVTDLGLGLDLARGDRLFEAFFTTKPEGMGMGCRSAVRSLMPMAADCGRLRICQTAPSSSSSCQRRGRHKRDMTTIRPETQRLCLVSLSCAKSAAIALRSYEGFLRKTNNKISPYQCRM